jgi:POT family proton-dependent oligopeptide transporter
MNNTTVNIQAEIPTTQPKALYVLFLAELWERFSYMGVRVLLILYMTSQLKYSDSFSYGIYGMFFTLVYASNLIGGYLADRYLGNRITILLGGCFMITGHICMALPFEEILTFGLAFIIIGTGFFKVNISSLLGQYYHPHDPRRDSGFTIFYMGINIGGLLAPILCGYVGMKYGWHYGFGLSGLGMSLGMLTFILGRPMLGSYGQSPLGNKLHDRALFNLSRLHWIIITSLCSIPLISSLIQQHQEMEIILYALGSIMLLSVIWMAMKCEGDEKKRMLTLIAMLPFYLAFWASFEQAGASINLFTERHVHRVFMGMEIHTTLFQSLNPLFIIMLAPFLSGLWLYLGKRGKEPPTPIKFALALFFVGLSFWFLKIGVQEASINGMASMIWVILAFLLQSTGELFISPVALSMVTKLAPARFSSFMMGSLFLSMAFAHFTAQQIAKYFSAAQEVSTVENITEVGNSLAIFKDIFDFLIYFPILMGLVMLLCYPLFKNVFKKYS